MVEGKFVDANKPMIQAVIAWEQAVQNPYFLLDTGFTGDLQVTPEMAGELGLTIDGVTEARIATNKIVTVSSATAFAIMEGKTIYVTVLISDGIPLLGISFMEKFNYKAIIDCKNKTVVLGVV